MHIKEIFWDDMEEIYLAQDSDTWWAAVNTVMNLHAFHKNAVNFLTS
jgi:hypothetical protein